MLNSRSEMRSAVAALEMWHNDSALSTDDADLDNTVLPCPVLATDSGLAGYHVLLVWHPKQSPEK